MAHAARVTGLQPNRSYCYEVWADGQALVTGLKADTAWTGVERPIRLLAFGDSGRGTLQQQAVREAFMSRQFDLFLHLGDLAYEDGTFPEFEEKVFGVYRDLMHRVPSFPAIGNHDYHTQNGRPYLDVYYLFEQALRPRDRERYYSFDYGNAHFVSLDSNPQTLLPIQFDLEGRKKDDMLDWLEADLRASKADWKIVFFHHPPLSQLQHRDLNQAVLLAIMPVLHRGGVDLILVGHDHHYVRSHPLRADCEVPGGRRAIPVLTVGTGGSELAKMDNPRDWWVAAGNDTMLGFLSLTLHGCSAKGSMIAADGSSLDEFEFNGCQSR